MSEQIPSIEDFMAESTRGNTITTEELDELCVKYAAAREEYDKAKESSTDLYNVAEGLKGKVVEAMTLAGKNKYIVEGIGTFGFKDTMSVKTPKSLEEKQTLWKYLEEKYGSEVVWDKFGINSKTLNSFYNSELEAFNELALAGKVSGDFHLPGIEAPTAQRDLKLTKEKKK